MSGYLDAHGDTMTIDLVVSNERKLYEQLQTILDGIQWDGQTWHGIDNAARDYRRMVRVLPRDLYTDLKGVDLDKVDFHGLIRSELGERNLYEGRDFDAGLGKGR